MTGDVLVEKSARTVLLFGGREQKIDEQKGVCHVGPPTLGSNKGRSPKNEERPECNVTRMS